MNTNITISQLLPIENNQDGITQTVNARDGSVTKLINFNK